MTTGNPPTYQSWRDTLPLHEAAEIIPKYTAEKLVLLGRFMKMAGRMNIPVIVFFDPVSGKYSLGDGRSRLDGLEGVGIKVSVQITDAMKVIITAKGIEIPEPQIITITDGFDPYAFVAETNVGRRQLLAAEKREIGAKLVIARPGLTDRAIARLACIDHKTVAAIRKEIQVNGELPHNAERVEETGRRARGRKPDQASKKAPVAAAAVGDKADRAGAQIVPAEQAVAPTKQVGTAVERKGAPTGAEVAADFSCLNSAGISKFITGIPPGHRDCLGHALSVAANIEIAEQARAAMAQLTHAEHNKDDIRKRLARVIALADPDLKSRKIKLAANKLDTAAAARALHAMDQSRRREASNGAHY